MQYKQPALAAILLATLSYAQTAPRDPILLPETTKKISPHVYVIPDTDTTPGVPNVGIILGTRAALVVDTGMGDRNGRIVLAEAQKLAPGRKLYLVTTHVHPEHDLGANAFPASTTMIRSVDQEKDIAEFGLQMAQVFSSRNAVNADLLKGATFRKADITYDDQSILDLGGTTVKIIALGTNHTRGDTAIFVTQDSVLFSGDDAMRGQPALISSSSSLSHWLTTLDLLEALHPRIVVPSHGPLGDVTFITTYRTYLTTVRDQTTRLKSQGKTVDEAIATLTPQMKPQFPDACRLAGAIRIAYKEAP